MASLPCRWSLSGQTGKLSKVTVVDIFDWSDKLVTMKTIAASEFKAKCLALLDEIAKTGEGVTVLKRGQPVAQVIPVVPRQHQYPQQTLLGTVEILGDIVGPVLPSHVWETESTQEERR